MQNILHNIKTSLQNFCLIVKNMKYAINTFGIYLIGIVIFSIFFNESKFGIYNMDFWHDFLINANASILDFLVIGVVLYYFEASKQNKESIGELLEDLQNYSIHSSIEMNIKKMKIIRKLNSKNVKKINSLRMKMDHITIKRIHFTDSELSGLDLTSSRLEEATFTGCNIQALILNNATLKNVVFTDCKIRNMKCIKAKLSNVKFIKCKLEGSDFSESSLIACMLKGSDLNNVNYLKTDLRNGNIKDCTNINIIKLTEAKNLNYVVCTEEQRRGIKQIKESVKFTELGN